jgi:toxin ParE1/3/4
MVEVTLTPGDMEDILEIYNYILGRDGEERAEAVLNRLEKKAYSLDKLALRGRFPEELAPFGNRKIREVQEAPWRIFYRIDEGKIYILAILDGRRALKEILESLVMR